MLASISNSTLQQPTLTPPPPANVRSGWEWLVVVGKAVGTLYYGFITFILPFFGVWLLLSHMLGYFLPLNKLPSLLWGSQPLSINQHDIPQWLGIIVILLFIPWLKGVVAIVAEVINYLKTLTRQLPEDSE